MVPDVFQYTDYRKFLRDWHTQAKADNRQLTYRMIAERVGFKSPAHFILIVKNRANISRDLALKFVRFLQLKKKAARYFLTMVLYNQADDHAEKRERFEELIKFEKSAVHLVDSKQYSFYHKWYHAAIRALLNFFPAADNYQELGKMLVPAISPAEARKSIELLAGLAFIKKDERGFWRPTGQFLTTGYDAQSVAVNNFVIGSMALADDAVERFPKDERNCSTLTIGASRESFEAMQNVIREFRRKIFEIVGSTPADRVYQLSMQLFPLSKPYPGPGVTNE